MCRCKQNNGNCQSRNKESAQIRSDVMCANPTFPKMRGVPHAFPAFKELRYVGMPARAVCPDWGGQSGLTCLACTCSRLNARIHGDEQVDGWSRVLACERSRSRGFTYRP